MSLVLCLFADGGISGFSVGCSSAVSFSGSELCLFLLSGEVMMSSDLVSLRACVAVALTGVGAIKLAIWGINDEILVEVVEAGTET